MERGVVIMDRSIGQHTASNVHTYFFYPRIEI